ncbi:MAG: hypothetical protein Q9214_004301 [Letrouitia sp. 1 TL-2023]
MKFELVLITETRVVEDARVRAAVKSAHIRALKARLRRKKRPRMANSMNLKREMELDQDEVSSVVVLGVVLVGLYRGGRGRNEQFGEYAIDGSTGARGGGEGEPRGFEGHVG